MVDPVVNETQSTNLTCFAFGLPQPTVMWSRFDLLTIPADSSKFVTYEVTRVPPTGGLEVQFTLQINSVNGSDTGNYTCTAINQPLGSGFPESSTSSVVELLVQSELEDENF